MGHSKNRGRRRLTLPLPLRAKMIGLAMFIGGFMGLITSAPRILAVGKANEFVLLLKDPQRQVPVVLVSCDRRTGVPKLDAGAMGRALAGTAIVYHAESPECDLELEQ